jgi:hypothetical protein
MRPAKTSEDFPEPDDGDEGRDVQGVHERVDIRVAPEETRVVILVERHHARVRAGRPADWAVPGDGVLQGLPQALDAFGPPGSIRHVQRREDRQPRRQLHGFEDERDDGPGRAVQPVGLGEEIPELAEAVREIRRGEDQECPLAVPDRVLELAQEGCAEGERRFRVHADARRCKGV